ncbi:MAG: M15 family metallopeptidase [Saprospiraceae bacterium]|nr:M15 family metallopeptidase [Saprospiraceae bacterium]
MKYLALSLLFLLVNCGSSSLDDKLPKAPPTTDHREPTSVSQPPTPGPIDYDTTQWTEITRLDPTILLDLRYATDNNFVKEKMYECPRCFFRPAVAKALLKAHKTLQKKGYGLKMYDCYRPRPIQWKLWKKVPDPRYVADPRKGSMHNRGMAADLTIVDKKGKELDMGTDFDFFGKEAYHAYTAHPQQVLDNRKLLLNTMAAVGMKFTTTEWWHYSYKPKTYPIADWVWECK